MFLGADRVLFKRAGALRKKQTFSEDLLWNYLRTKPFGFKFRQQHPISSYILDFYCHSLKLAIEVDGSIHELKEVKENDAERQGQLEREGTFFLRISNDQIRLQLEDVIRQIERYFKRENRKKKSLFDLTSPFRGTGGLILPKSHLRPSTTSSPNE